MNDKTDSLLGDYLMRAYLQDHFTEKKEMMDFIESEFGTGFLFDLHSKFIDKYGMPKLGTSRATYISKSCVFKIPISLEGFRLNDWEGSLCSIGEEGTEYYIPLAKSKLLYINDIPVVAMERVIEASLDDIKEKYGFIPDFVSAVDMGQVGFDSKGKLVAYDYADL